VGIVANNKLKILLFAMGMAILISSPAFAAGVSINNGATYTWTTKVILYLTRPDVSYNKVAITNHLGYGGSGNITYSPTKEWTLEPGEGTKTVYVIFGNTSNQWTSNYSDTITIQFDRTAPTAPTNLQIGDFGGPRMYFNVGAGILGAGPSTDPLGSDGIPEIVSGVGSYLINTQGPSHAGFETVNLPFKWYNDLAEGIYTMKMCAADRAGNLSPFSNEITFYVDLTKPPQPENVRASTTKTSTGNFTLSWDGVTDNPGGSGIRNYRVLIYPPGSTNYSGYISTTETSYSFKNFPNNGDYHFHVCAVDNANWVSDKSASFARVMIDKITPEATISYFNGWYGDRHIRLETSRTVGPSGTVDADVEYKMGPIDSDGKYVLGNWLEYGGKDWLDISVTAYDGLDNYAYQFRYAVINGIGAWSSYSEPSNVVKIDVQEPEAPNITQPARDPEHPYSVAVVYDMPAEISGEVRDVIYSSEIADPKDWSTGGSGIATVEIKIVSKEGTSKYRFWEKTQQGNYRWSLISFNQIGLSGDTYTYGGQTWTVSFWIPVPATRLIPHAYQNPTSLHYYDTWSLPSNLLPAWDEGIIYTIIPRATDKVGKLSRIDYGRDTIDVKIDRTPPPSDKDVPDVLIISTPPAATVAKVPNIPRITGEAHDAWSGIATVEVRIRKPDSGRYRFWQNYGTYYDWSPLRDDLLYDGPEVWNLTTLESGSPNDTWSFSLNPLLAWPAGVDTDVRIWAKATDKAGNQKTVPKSVTVNPSTVISYTFNLVPGINWISIPLQTPQINSNNIAWAADLWTNLGLQSGEKIEVPIPGTDNFASYAVVTDTHGTSVIGTNFAVSFGNDYRITATQTRPSAITLSGTRPSAASENQLFSLDNGVNWIYIPYSRPILLKASQLWTDVGLNSGDKIEHCFPGSGAFESYALVTDAHGTTMNGVDFDLTPLGCYKITLTSGAPKGWPVNQ